MTRMRHVRGNHDAMRDPAAGAPRARRTPSRSTASCSRCSTPRCPGDVGGALPARAARLARRPRRRHDRIRCSCSRTIPAFNHDRRLRARRSPTTTPLLDAGRAAREHRRLPRRAHAHATGSSATRGAARVPFVEVACTKDYPGAWAEYRVYEGGYTQVMRRVAEPAARRVVGARPHHDPGDLPRPRARRHRRPLLHPAILTQPATRTESRHAERQLCFAAKLTIWKYTRAPSARTRDRSPSCRCPSRFHVGRAPLAKNVS